MHFHVKQRKPANEQRDKHKAHEPRNLFLLPSFFPTRVGESRRVNAKQSSAWVLRFFRTRSFAVTCRASLVAVNKQTRGLSQGHWEFARRCL